MKTYLSFAALLLLLSCSEKEIAKDTPSCVRDLIENIKKEDSAGSPGKVVRYRYEGRTVYYIPPRCCDISSTLMDEQCNRICSPDGGLSGTGDGKCPDFFEKVEDAEIVWKDDRVK